MMEKEAPMPVFITSPDVQMPPEKRSKKEAGALRSAINMRIKLGEDPKTTLTILLQNSSIRAVAEDLGTNFRIVSGWVGQLEIPYDRVAAINNGPHMRSFSLERRREVGRDAQMRRIQALLGDNPKETLEQRLHTETITQIAADLGKSIPTIRTWIGLLEVINPGRSKKPSKQTRKRGETIMIKTMQLKLGETPAETLTALLQDQSKTATARSLGIDSSTISNWIKFLEINTTRPKIVKTKFPRGYGSKERMMRRMLAVLGEHPALTLEAILETSTLEQAGAQLGLGYQGLRHWIDELRVPYKRKVKKVGKPNPDLANVRKTEQKARIRSSLGEEPKAALEQLLRDKTIREVAKELNRAIHTVAAWIKVLEIDYKRKKTGPHKLVL